MPALVSQQLVPPPWTGGQVCWHCRSLVQLPQVMPPLLLPLVPPELLPLPPPLLLELPGQVGPGTMEQVPTPA
jgi:hypothetical protein